MRGATTAAAPAAAAVAAATAGSPRSGPYALSAEAEAELARLASAATKEQQQEEYLASNAERFRAEFGYVIELLSSARLNFNVRQVFPDSTDVEVS